MPQSPSFRSLSRSTRHYQRLGINGVMSSSTLALGTPGRSPWRLRHTGRRCRIRSRSQLRNGGTPSATTAGASAVTDRSLPVEARRLRSARLGLPQRSQTPPTARRGLSRADGYCRRSTPFTGRDSRGATGRDGERDPSGTGIAQGRACCCSGFLPADAIPARAASTTDRRQQSAQRCGGDLYVPSGTI